MTKCLVDLAEITRLIFLSWVKKSEVRFLSLSTDEKKKNLDISEWLSTECFWCQLCDFGCNPWNRRIGLCFWKRWEKSEDFKEKCGNTDLASKCVMVGLGIYILWKISSLILPNGQAVMVGGMIHVLCS